MIKKRQPYEGYPVKTIDKFTKTVGGLEFECEIIESGVFSGKKTRFEARQKGTMHDGHTFYWNSFYDQEKAEEFMWERVKRVNELKELEIKLGLRKAMAVV